MEACTEYYRRYKDWVRKNANVLALLETGASSLTWLLPDRFNDNEISLEAMHTAINLVSVFHEGIIGGPGTAAPRGAAELTSALAALQQIEVLVELWALWNERTGGLSSRYDPLIAVEGLKVLVRLAIFRTANARILTNGGATAFEPAALFAQRGVGGAGKGGSEGRAKEVYEAFAAFREKRCFMPPTKVQKQQQQETESDPIEFKISSSAADKSPPQPKNQDLLWWRTPVVSIPPLVSPSASLDALRDLEERAAQAQAAAARLLVAGELLHILRPLVYVLALRRWGRRSWKSWMLSLAVELASARLTTAGASTSRCAAAAAATDPAVASTSLAPLYAMQGVAWRRDELDELTRRKLLLGYYLLRDPFFSKFTGPAVERWRSRLARVPLVGWTADKAAELLTGVQKYYSYTAAS